MPTISAPPPEQEHSTYLYCTGGGSDKEYHAHLRRQGGMWVVDYANGKRGHVGQSKPKTPSAVSFVAAKDVYDALVKAKKKDGYTESATGVRFTNTDNERAASGHIQQQCVAVEREDAQTMLSDPAWGAQQKANGERRTVVVLGDQVKGINKLGLYVNIPETWLTQFRDFGDCKMDGEQVGAKFFAFDLLAVDGCDISQMPFDNRIEQLSNLLAGNQKSAPSIEILGLARSEQAKRNLMARLEAERHEGLVFKRLDAPYIGGRDDNTRKFKFFESSTFQVLAINQKRSVQIGLLDELAAMVNMGNVNIPSGVEIPSIGDLVEVRYLYYNPGGALEHSSYLGVRNDVLPQEAVLSQIKRLKPDEGACESEHESLSDAPNM